MANETLHPAGEDPADALTATIASAASLFAALSIQDTLDQVVNLAVSSIDGCDFAGIFLREGAAVTTPVCSDPVVTEIDALQHAAGEGPCLDALGGGGPFYAEDLGSEPRWPVFGPQAVAHGVYCVLALTLDLGTAPGALNLYARQPRAFTAVDRAQGLLLSSLAGAAFTTARVHEEEQHRAAQLREALSTREMIGQAQGILMERERVSAEQAFDILRKASQHLNLKLRVVAQSLVDTGERPDTGVPGGP